jgi:hypothetical protein
MSHFYELFVITRGSLPNLGKQVAARAHENRNGSRGWKKAPLFFQSLEGVVSSGRVVAPSIAAL